ncbi:MAG: TonB-dependent receptor plug domain-containing protein [Prolixibacteraceae bacterium]
MKKGLFLTCLLVLQALLLFAQNVSEKDTLVGLILNAKGKGIKNVPVFVKEQDVPVKTDRKGIFTIAVNDLPDSITIMLPSQKLFQIPVNNRNYLKIRTGEAACSVMEARDEIIRIGYGVERQSRSTQSSFSVSGQELLETGERDIIHAIAGKVPGLNLTFKENGAVSIQIRGGTGMGDEHEPLYIVDGSIVDDLTYVNLNDVEKVDVLKDGSIFGTRGANGAIVVTTKN